MKRLLSWMPAALALIGGAAAAPPARTPGTPGEAIPQPGQIGPVRILEKTGVEYAYPRWSADGKRILYQSNVSGRWQLYVMNENGNGITQITRDSSNNNFPDWSPDDSRIAFVSDRDGNEEIYVMDTDGKNLRRLTSDRNRDIHPYWTPDGTKILFNSTRDDSGVFEVYEMRPDGSALKRLTTSGDDETCARLAPSGGRMVYLKNNESGLDDLFLMDLKTGRETNLTNTPTTDGWPAWFPGRNAIVWSAIEGNVYKLFLLNLTDSSLKRLTDPPAPSYDCRANISADGRKIVFNRQVDGPKNTIGIYVLRLE